MSATASSYPISLEIDGPKIQNRPSVLLRYIYAIPHLIVVQLLMTVTGILTFLAWIAIVVTGKYPQSLANFVVGSTRWALRANGYLLLLTDKYPAFSLDDDGVYPIRPSLSVNLEARNRVTVLLRIIMAIPHLIVLEILGIVAAVVALISWLAALFTGSVPAGMHQFLANFSRYSARVCGYVLLMTDEYPPFSLS